MTDATDRATLASNLHAVTRALGECAAMNRALPSVFDLLQTTLIKLRRSRYVPEEETAFEELKESVVRTAAELSILRDPHDKEDLASPGEQPAEAPTEEDQNGDSAALIRDHSEDV